MLIQRQLLQYIFIQHYDFNFILVHMSTLITLLHKMAQGLILFLHHSAIQWRTYLLRYRWLQRLRLNLWEKESAMYCRIESQYLLYRKM